jgi:hypothetical protein
MLRIRRTTMVLVIALVCAMAIAAVAAASPFSPPIQKSPGNHHTVHAGVVTLIVKDPGVPKDVRPVYATIDPRRALNKYGELKELKCAGGCDFVALHPWKGHPGFWIYKSQFNFPGYWAVTPGKYFWQAVHVAPLCQAKGCSVVSPIHWFRVVG